MRPDRPGSGKAAEALAHELLRETREELNRAGGKASALLAAVLVVAGLFLSSALAGTWSPLVFRPPARLLWWAGTGLFAAGVCFLYACICPRVTNEVTREVLAYFGHVHVYPTREDLEEALLHHSAARLPRLTHELFVLSRIVGRKFRYMRLAVWAFGLASVLGAGSFLLDQLPRH